MQVTFYGVRGSIPAPGPETNRYGGNTSCVAVRTAEGALVILDAGTGVIPLGHELMKSEFAAGQGAAAVLLTHSHWDHIQGFPFFRPIFVPGNRIVIYGLGSSSSVLDAILEGQMNPHFSPLYTMRNLGASIELAAVHPDGHREFTVAGLRVRSCPNPHGSTTALAYRLEEEGRVLIYAPDAGYPSSGPPAESIALYQGADLLIHDATYSPEDRIRRIERGFSSIQEAAQVAARARVGHLVITHYDQDYGDDMVDVQAERCRGILDGIGAKDIRLTAAREGLTLVV